MALDLRRMPTEQQRKCCDFCCSLIPKTAVGPANSGCLEDEVTEESWEDNLNAREIPPIAGLSWDPMGFFPPWFPSRKQSATGNLFHVSVRLAQ